MENLYVNRRWTEREGKAFAAMLRNRTAPEPIIRKASGKSVVLFGEMHEMRRHIAFLARRMWFFKRNGFETLLDETFCRDFQDVLDDFQRTRDPALSALVREKARVQPAYNRDPAVGEERTDNTMRLLDSAREAGIRVIGITTRAEHCPSLGIHPKDIRRWNLEWSELIQDGLFRGKVLVLCGSNHISPRGVPMHLGVKSASIAFVGEYSNNDSDICYVTHRTGTRRSTWGLDIDIGSKAAARLGLEIDGMIHLGQRNVGRPTRWP